MTPFLSYFSTGNAFGFTSFDGLKIDDKQIMKSKELKDESIMEVSTMPVCIRDETSILKEENPNVLMDDSLKFEKITVSVKLYDKKASEPSFYVTSNLQPEGGSLSTTHVVVPSTGSDTFELIHFVKSASSYTLDLEYTYKNPDGSENETSTVHIPSITIDSSYKSQDVKAENLTFTPKIESGFKGVSTDKVFTLASQAEYYLQADPNIDYKFLKFGNNVTEFTADQLKFTPMFTKESKEFTSIPKNLFYNVDISFNADSDVDKLLPAKASIVLKMKESKPNQTIFEFEAGINNETSYNWHITMDLSNVESVIFSAEYNKTDEAKATESDDYTEPTEQTQTVEVKNIGNYPRQLLKTRFYLNPVNPVMKVTGFDTNVQTIVLENKVVDFNDRTTFSGPLNIDFGENQEYVFLTFKDRKNSDTNALTILLKNLIPLELPSKFKKFGYDLYCLSSEIKTLALRRKRTDRETITIENTNLVDKNEYNDLEVFLAAPSAPFEISKKMYRLLPTPLIHGKPSITLDYSKTRQDFKYSDDLLLYLYTRSSSSTSGTVALPVVIEIPDDVFSYEIDLTAVESAPIIELYYNGIGVIIQSDNYYNADLKSGYTSFRATSLNSVWSFRPITNDLTKSWRMMKIDNSVYGLHLLTYPSQAGISASISGIYKEFFYLFDKPIYYYKTFEGAVDDQFYGMNITNPKLERTIKDGEAVYTLSAYNYSDRVIIPFDWSKLIKDQSDFLYPLGVNLDHLKFGDMRTGKNGEFIVSAAVAVNDIDTGLMDKICMGPIEDNIPEPEPSSSNGESGSGGGENQGEGNVNNDARAWTIVGSVIGVVFVIAVAIVAFFAFRYVKRKKERKMRKKMRRNLANNVDANNPNNVAPVDGKAAPTEMAPNTANAVGITPSQPVQENPVVDPEVPPADGAAPASVEASPYAEAAPPPAPEPEQTPAELPQGDSNEVNLLNNEDDNIEELVLQV